jgi:hypothetical protein
VQGYPYESIIEGNEKEPLSPATTFIKGNIVEKE